MKIFTVGLIITAALVISSALLTPSTSAHASSKGLKVFLTVNTNLVQQPIAIDAFQFDEFIAGYDEYITPGPNEIVLEFYKGEIQTGEFSICVKAVDIGLRQCGYGYNTDKKEPAYVTVNLYQTNSPTPTVPDDQSQSQAQSSNNENNNENNNALSQSQETTIIICKDGDCKPT